MRLRRSDRSEPGILRRKRGRGFTYVDERSGRPVDDEQRARIRALAIPPAWTDVWICRDARGHLQAVGIDAAGREQYRYHDRWTASRSRQKFRRSQAFGEALRPARTRIRRHLASPVLDERRALATGARLLDLGLFRIGSDRYRQDNGSYGLSTLHNGQVAVVGSTVRFRFRAKGGIRQELEIRDGEIAGAVSQMIGHPGPLLGYVDASGTWTGLSAAALNAYIAQMIGEGFSAKDFRTWHGTVRFAAASALLSDEPPRNRIRLAIEETSKVLGNTPAVARASYVDPRMIDAAADGVTIRTANARRALERPSPAAEREVAAILEARPFP